MQLFVLSRQFRDIKFKKSIVLCLEPDNAQQSVMQVAYILYR